jgi:hypothetical protein
LRVEQTINQAADSVFPKRQPGQQMAAGTDAEKREAKRQIVSFENQPKKHQKAAGLRSAALSFNLPAVYEFSLKTNRRDRNPVSVVAGNN